MHYIYNNYSKRKMKVKTRDTDYKPNINKKTLIVREMKFEVIDDFEISFELSRNDFSMK
jgi:hypothetical protein